MIISFATIRKYAKIILFVLSITGFPKLSHATDYKNIESHPDSAINLLHEKHINEYRPPSVWMLDSIQTMHLPSEDKWWTHFNDPLLNRLIALANENNSDLKIALKQIEIASNQVRQAKAAYYPSIGVNASWDLMRSSGVTGKTRQPASVDSYFDIGLTASWEADVFGRVKANVNAQNINRNISRIDYVASQVSIAAQVAKYYISIRLYQRQLEIATNHINSQQRIVKITEAREEAGLSSMLDVSQARTVLYSTEATLPALKALIRTTTNSLGVLVGIDGIKLAELLGPYGDLPDYSQLVPVAVPADIVRRRPDIIKAQYQLDEDLALIGISRKDYLPTLSISGSIGTSSRKVSDLFSSPSFTYMVSPQISWTAFDGNLRGLKTGAAKLQFESDTESYNLTVRNAAQEVNNAIADYESNIESIKLKTKVVEESENSLRLALDRYKQGLAAFTNVADAQQDLLSYENTLVSAQAQALTSLINLYVAIGGGWSILPE